MLFEKTRPDWRDPMNQRRTLANRRGHELHEFWFRNNAYVLGVGRFDDGAIAEIFIDCSKVTSESANDARDAAVCLSIAMQCGTPIDAIRAAVTREENGSPSGIIGHVLDLLSKE